MKSFGALIAACCVGVVLFFLDRVGYLSHYRAVSERTLISFVSSAGLAREKLLQPFQYMQDVRELQQYIRDLESERAELLAEKERANKEQTEFETWKEHRELQNQFLPTWLILTNSASIPMGSQQDIESGSMVLAHGVMIGRVRDVRPQFSSVELLVAMQTKLPVRIRELNIEGVLERDGDHVVLTHLDSQAKIVEGLIVTTVGDDRGLLPFIPLGRVSRVLSSESEPSQRVEIELLITPTNGMPVVVLPTLEHSAQQKGVGND